MNEYNSDEETALLINNNENTDEYLENVITESDTNVLYSESNNTPNIIGTSNIIINNSDTTSLLSIRTPPPDYTLHNRENNNLLPRYEDLTYNTITILFRDHYYLIVYNKYLYNFTNSLVLSRIAIELVFIIFNIIYYFYYEKIKKENTGLILSLVLHAYFCLYTLCRNYKFLPLYCKNKIKKKETKYYSSFIICGDLITTFLIFEYALFYKYLIIKCIYIMYIVINYIIEIILYVYFQELLNAENLKFIKHNLINNNPTYNSIE